MPHGKILLMTPGPTLVDSEVLLELARATINHVSDEFDSIHLGVVNNLKKIFGTSGDLIVLPGSGTSAMELALRSVVKRGSKVLVLKTGYFAGYLADGVRYLEGSPEIVESELGKGFDGNLLDRIIEKHRDVDVIAFQHVDTSTSVANPVSELAKVAGDWGLRAVVDGVASIGGMEMEMDKWGVDVCFTGSQKALGVPPGLGIVAFGSRFSQELDESSSLSLYFNIPKLRREMQSTKNYYITPAVNLVYGLAKSINNILEEGLENRYKRHRIMAEAVRGAAEKTGLKLVAKEGFQADTVTAIYLPEGVIWPDLYRSMKAKGVEIAGGLGELKGKIFRIGHMGQVGYNEIIATIAALERSLRELGYPTELGTAISHVQQILAGYGN